MDDLTKKQKACRRYEEWDEEKDEFGETLVCPKCKIREGCIRYHSIADDLAHKYAQAIADYEEFRRKDHPKSPDWLANWVLG